MIYPRPFNATNSPAGGCMRPLRIPNPVQHAEDAATDRLLAVPFPKKSPSAQLLDAAACGIKQLTTPPAVQSA